MNWFKVMDVKTKVVIFVFLVCSVALVYLGFTGQKAKSKNDVYAVRIEIMNQTIHRLQKDLNTAGKTTTIIKKEYIQGTSTPTVTVETIITEPVQIATTKYIYVQTIPKKLSIYYEYNFAYGFGHENGFGLGLGYTPYPNITFGVKARKNYIGVWGMLGVGK